MKQVVQDLRNGETNVVDVPTPGARAGALQICTSMSLVSAGTERMLVEFGRGNVVAKVRQQPDKVRQVVEKVRTDGLLPTLEAVQGKLGQPLPLGYCNVGRVTAVGDGVDGFEIGDRVVSNGAHAEVVVVPKNLCARVPDGVDDEAAAFTVLASIALQGVRLAEPTLGEAVVVTGLGLVGLITVQILRANGCRVLGIDMDPGRLEMARRFGAEVVDLAAGQDPIAAAAEFSRGRGVDAVLLTASTKSSAPVSQAAQMCRKRGRIVLVGVTGLELSRADFFQKELSFRVSCSYGPGRYDPTYEQKGVDYPVGFVRWTEQRNFEAVLDLMASGAIDPEPLVSHRFDVAEAEQAFDLLVSDAASLGISIRYRGAEDDALPRSLAATRIKLGPRPVHEDGPAVGVIGAGNYGGRILLSAFQAGGAELHTLASVGGLSAAHYGRKYGFHAASSDADAVLSDGSVDAVAICTRHDSHARFVEKALAAGKDVFVEKPLCLTLDELDAIEAVIRRADENGVAPRLMVGFNRRFAPQVVRMKALLSSVSAPKSLIMTVNAGAIPHDSWTQDPAVGGGRLVGEACHFIDLLRHLVGAPVRDYEVATLDEENGPPRSDNASITLRFEDGSVGTVHYLACGHKGVAKERLEVFCAGRVLQLDNFRQLRGYGWSGFSKSRLWRQDKGQTACVAAFIKAFRDGAPAPIPLDEILEVSRIAIEVGERT